MPAVGKGFVLHAGNEYRRLVSNVYKNMLRICTETGKVTHNMSSKKAPCVYVGTKITADLRDRFKRRADSQGRTAASLLRLLIKKELATE